jgi:hypothetical protein
VPAESTAAPQVSLRQVSAGREAATNRWNIRWEVENLGNETLKINSLRLPHGQFKSDEQFFTPALALAGGGSQPFSTLVYCPEASGLLTENAFVIFHCRWRGDAWRIFVRIRVTVKAGDGVPETATELITTQKVGFSGIAN